MRQALCHLRCGRLWRHGREGGQRRVHLVPGASPEAIPTNILASRLRQLEEAGLIEKRPYQKRPQRFEYALTKQGEALLPVLQEVCRWANAHIEGTWRPPDSFMQRRL